MRIKNKFQKKLTAIVLTLAMILSFIFILGISGSIISAADNSITYIAFGDSVPDGYGLDNPEINGYVNLFAEQLKTDGVEVNTYNMAKSGMTTTDLLSLLNNLNKTDEALLKSANIVTVNIGGNNILGPMITSIYKIMTNMGILDITKITPAQAGQLAVNLMTFVPDEELKAELNKGVELFAADFAKIIKLLKTKAPNAEIIINTIYNPIPSLLAISKSAEEIIPAMNKVITDSQNQKIGKYAVADVYSAFKSANAAGIAVTNVNLDPSKGNYGIDIHPNAAGHALIALIQPTSDNYDISVTRGMTVGLLYNITGSPNADIDSKEVKNNFKDVDKNKWYADAVKWASETGIVKGYGNGNFGPENKITKQDLAVIILRFEEFTKKIPKDILMDRKLTDWNNISDYAKDSVNRLLIQGLLDIKSDGKFFPKEYATRNDFAYIIQKFLSAKMG